MLRQEINLFNSFKSPELATSRLTWQFFWMITALFFLIFTINATFILWDLHRFNQQKNALLQQNNVLEQNILQLKSAYPADFFSQDVTKSLTQLKDEFYKQQQLLNAIGNKTPFSQDLTALAQISVSNLWLTQFTITNGGKEITLKGESLGMENLQTFLANMNNHPIFTNYYISGNNIEKLNNATKNDHLTFEVTISHK